MAFSVGAVCVVAVQARVCLLLQLLFKPDYGRCLILVLRLWLAKTSCACELDGCDLESNAFNTGVTGRLQRAIFQIKISEKGSKSLDKTSDRTFDGLLQPLMATAPEYGVCRTHAQKLNSFCNLTSSFYSYFMHMYLNYMTYECGGRVAPKTWMMRRATVLAIAGFMHPWITALANRLLMDKAKTVFFIYQCALVCLNVNSNTCFMYIH